MSVNGDEEEPNRLFNCKSMIKSKEIPTVFIA